MSQLELLKQRKFLPLFWTQFFGAFNDNFLKNALVILVTEKSASIAGLPYSQIVVLSGGIFILPFFLFSALAGQIADKYEKTTVIKFIKATEVAIMIIATFGFMTERFELLLVSLFLMGLHSTFFGPIKYSILPQHLSTDEIVSGNALIEAGTFLAILLGTIGGGSLIAGVSGPMIVSTGLIAVAIIGLLTSLAIPRAPAVAPELHLQFNPIGPTIAAFGFARQVNSVYMSILGISWFWFFGAALLSLFAPLCKDVLGGDHTLITTLLAVFSIGIGCGSLLCSRLSRHQLELGLVPFGSLGLSVFGALLYFLCTGYVITPEPVSALTFVSIPRGAMVLADLFALSMFGGLFIVPLYTMMQERSEAKQRSRVIAANNILNALFMVVSSLFLSALIAFHVTIPMMILILSLLNLFVGVYIYTLLPEFFLRFLAVGLAHLIYRMRVSGRKNIPKKGAAILICNHVSFIDWLIIYASVPRPARFVMDKKYVMGGPFSWLFRGAKVIPIASAKEDPAALQAAYEQIRQELRNGQLVCIFPEGTITKTGELNEFKPGVLKMVGEIPVPIIPMALNGLWGSLFSRKDRDVLSRRPRKFWARIGLKIGAPIAPETATLEKLRNSVVQLL